MSTPDIAAEMAAAVETLKNQIGSTLSTVSIHADDADDAAFLGRNVSKLSPFVGNLVEHQIASDLEDRTTDTGLTWVRQDPYFPDAALFDAASKYLGAGFEVKAWYCLSTELTARFRESVRLLVGKDIRLLVVAWVMDRIVYGNPLILDTLVIDAESVARKRDEMYHDPPKYLIVEPEDTTERTANLQQSNVNGYRFQSGNQAALNAIVAKRGSSAEPHTEKAQAEARRLMEAGVYRLDTNFAKIDRIDHPAIEALKSRVLKSSHLGPKIADWGRLLGDLEGPDAKKRAAAEAAVKSLFD